jgi:transcription initiation factor TFIIIB Brf1 subunit/transcription initiation factor TFIIB
LNLKARSNPGAKIMETLFKKFSATTASAAADTMPDFEWEDTPSKTGLTAAPESCPFCDSYDKLDKSDHIICRSCGYVIERSFDSGAEYRYFAQEDRGGDPTRVGAPQDAHLPQASLGTVILNGYGSAKTMYKVRKYHSWNTIPYKERALIQTYERLSLIGLNFGINQSAIEATKSTYITLQDVGGRQGLSRDAMLSACLYVALKGSGSPRKPKEVADIFGISSATFTKALKQMQEVMALARQKGHLDVMKKPQSASTKAKEYITLPLSRLPIQRTQMDHLASLAEQIANKVETDGLSQENMPPSLAAGCIAFVLKRAEAIDIPLTKIAEAAEISVATLQKCLRRLETHSEVLEELIGLKS